jgi:hypothetical protein
MARIKKLLLLLLLSYACLAMKCASSAKLESGNVSQEEIHQSYAVRRTNESLEIRARFRLKDRSGDTLALTPPSQVSFNGKVMVRRDYFMSGISYFADEKDYPTSNRFEFTDTKGKTCVNSISFEPVEFAVDSIQLRKAAQTAIPVTRIVKEEDTKVLLTVREENSRKEFSAEVHGGRGVAGFRSSVYFDEAKKAIILEPDFLKEIAEGAASVLLVVRKEKDSLQQATARGGDITVEYDANPLNAKVSAK